MKHQLRFGHAILLLLFGAVCVYPGCEETLEARPAEVAFKVDPKTAHAYSVAQNHRAELAADAGPDNFVACDPSLTKEGQWSIVLSVKRMTPELAAKVPKEIEGLPVEVQQEPAAPQPPGV